MYSLAAYGQMLADQGRCNAYAAALESVITPGCTVVEIGCGPGVFAVHAARLGAGRVYAIEPDDVISLGPPLAAQHGVGERVSFHQTTSQAFELDTPADVVFSDLRGVLPFFQSHLSSVMDARQRLLAPGGALVPAVDTLRAAVVTAEDVFRTRAGVWSEGLFGIDLGAVWKLEQNRPAKVVLPASASLTPCATVATLDYRAVNEATLVAEVTWPVAVAGDAHGVAVWFDTDLHKGIGFSCAPGNPGLIYGQMFFPLPRPVAVVEGDEVALRLSGHLTGGDYLWRWRTEIRTAGGVERFDQSSFWAEPLSLASLRRRAADHRPVRSETATMMAFVFARMDGDHPLDAIAQALYEAFPDQLDSQREALNQVSAWSVDYGG